MTEKKKEYHSLDEFWLFYLSEHSDFTNRLLHFLGGWVAIGFVATTFYLRNPWFLLAALLSGYGFAWIGHFFVEKNRPASFKYPLRSFVCDWIMFGYILTGQIGTQLKRIGKNESSLETPAQGS